MLAVFVAVYAGMALGRWPGLTVDRTGIALLGAIALHLAGAVDGRAALDAIDFETLVVLFGLMVLSAQFLAAAAAASAAAATAAGTARPERLVAATVAVGGAVSAVLAVALVIGTLLFQEQAAVVFGDMRTSRVRKVWTCRG